MDYNTALAYSSTTTLLVIQYTRTNTVVFNEVNNGTVGTKYFVAGTGLNFTNLVSSYLTLVFNITTPSSQTPWTFIFTFKRPSGAYFQLLTTLTSIAATFSTSAVNISSGTYEMAVETNY